MPKQYTYTDHKTGRVLFESVEPNHVSIDAVDRKVLQATGRDPRLDPMVVRQIRVVTENASKVSKNSPPAVVRGNHKRR